MTRRRRLFGAKAVITLKNGDVITDELAVADAHPLGARPFARPQYVEKFTVWPTVLWIRLAGTFLAFVTDLAAKLRRFAGRAEYRCAADLPGQGPHCRQGAVLMSLFSSGVTDGDKAHRPAQRPELR